MAYGEQKIKLPPGATLIQEDEIKLPKGATLITDETVKKKDGIDVSSTESSPTPSGYSSKSLFGNFPTKDEYEATNPRNLPTQGKDKVIKSITDVLPSTRSMQQPQVADKIFLPKPITDVDVEKQLKLTEQKKVKLKTAIDNTTKNALKIKGINAPEGSQLYNDEKSRIEKMVENGDATYHMGKDGKPGLDRTMNWWEGLANGWDEAINGEDEATAFTNMTTEQKVEYANKKAEEKPPSEFIGEQYGLGGSAGHLLSSSAPFLAKATGGAILGTMTGGLGAPVIGAIAATAPDMINQGMKDEVLSRYQQLKKENPNANDTDLMKQAESGMVSGGIQGAAQDLLFIGTGLKAPLSMEGKAVLGENITKSLTSSAHVGLVTGGVKAAGLAERAAEGYDVKPQEIIDESVKTATDNFTGMLALNGLLHGVTGLTKIPKNVMSAFKYGLKDTPTSEIQAVLQANEKAGKIPEGSTEKVVKDIEEYKSALSKTSPTLTPEAQASVAGLMQARDHVAAEMETKDATQQAPYIDKINKYNEQIKKVTDTNKPFDYEVDDVTGKPLDGKISELSIDKSETTTTEEISQPTELNVTPTEQGEGVVIEPPMEVPEPITIKPELPKIEVVNEEPKNEVHQPTEVKEPTITEPNKEIKTTEEGNGKEPPSEGVDEVLSEGEELSGITHADTEADRKKLGIEEYEKKPKTDEELNNAADEAIKKGVDIDKLIAKIEKDKFASDLDITILKKAKAALDAKVEANPTNENIAAVHRLVKATDIAGSEQGRGLRARQGMLPKEDSISDFFIREMENSGVDELTNAQKEKVTKEYEDIKAANEKLQSDNEALRQANAKLEAEKELKKGNYGKKTSTKKDYKAQRESLKEKLKQQFKEFQEEGQKLGIASNGGVKSFVISAQMAKTIGEIVKTHVGEVGADLKEVTKRAFDDVKDLIKGISEKDIHDVIAGVYNEKKQTRSEVAIKLRDLRDEAALVNKLDQLLRGEEPKNEKQKVQRNKQITELRNKIKEIREGNLSSERTPEQERAALQTIKTRNESEIKKIEQQLKNDVFPKEEKKSSILQDRELQKKYPDLYKAALESRDKLIKLKQQREIRLIQQEYNNRTNKQKAGDVALEALNIPRTLMSSMDYSAPLRQGAWALVSHPQIGGKNLLKMFKDSFSQKHFDRWFYETKESPEFQVMEKSNLFVADPHDYRLSAKEEAFMNNLAEKIPVVGKLIKGSERAYVGFLNRMRVDIFRNFMDVALNDGKTIENSPELYKAMAEYINSTTGRGSVGKLEAAAPILNSLFFSPRLIASRINLLTMPFNPKTYTSLPKEVRVEYFKGLSKFVGVGLSVLALAKLSGAQVEDDPRSSDFGKIRSGNTRWDIWGGFQQYIRAFAQLSTGQRKSSNLGDIQKLDGKGAFGTNRGDIVTSFARGKLAPVPSMAWDFISGKTPTGEDATIKNEAIGHLVPLMVSDMKEAVKDRGVSALFTVGVPSIFGVGTQTYQPGKSSFLFSKAEVETNPTLKSYYDRDISFPPVSKAQHKIDVDKDHPNMAKEGEKPYSLMTDKEFEDFKKYQKEGLLDGVKDERGKKVADGLKDILKSTYIVLVKDKHGSIIKHERVKGEKLPDEELKKKVSNLKENATKYALKKLKLNNKPETTTKVKKVY